MIPRQRLRKISLHASHSAMPEISLTPLIDTALVLLVIFMITTPMMHNALKLTLPKGQVNDTVQAPVPITVSITQADELFVDDQLVSQAELVQVLQQKIGDMKAQPVYVYGDESISYAKLMQVLDSIKYIAGVDDVILATSKA